MEPHLNPDEIRFCQCTIRDCFTSGENLLSVFIKLFDGALVPQNMTGRVQAHWLTEQERIKHKFSRNNVEENHWYAVEGNRRLYIFKKLKQSQRLPNNTIPYKNLGNIDNKIWKFTTKNRGTSIKFYKPYIPHDGLGVERRINDIVQRRSVTQSDRDFARNYVGKQPAIASGYNSALMSDGGVEAAYAGADVEEDVYYESDDDGL